MVDRASPAQFTRGMVAIRLPVQMSLREAEGIAGTLGRTTKMPGYSYGLDARNCLTGSILAQYPGTVCYGCYALGDFYQWRPARVARERREAGIHHPRWEDAMVRLITHRCASLGEPYFRWHDSGDLQGTWHLERIVRVCERTPQIAHWIPTRENHIVEDFLRRGGTVPDNLVVRISAHVVGHKPRLRPRLRGVPTSTVHTEPRRPVRVGRRRRDSIECRASDRGNECGPCRACWSPRVRNVSYLEHVPRNMKGSG